MTSHLKTSCIRLALSILAISLPLHHGDRCSMLHARRTTSAPGNHQRRDATKAMFFRPWKEAGNKFRAVTRRCLDAWSCKGSRQGLAWVMHNNRIWRYISPCFIFKLFQPMVVMMHTGCYVQQPLPIRQSTELRFRFLGRRCMKGVGAIRATAHKRER
jgi:hypothetical protein